MGFFDFESSFVSPQGSIYLAIKIASTSRGVQF